jgi:type IV pilus assembly protein PilE
VNRTSGFSLIEMLIAIAIMGILTMVAYPAYTDSTRKSRRSDGMAAVLTIQVSQEKFRGNCPFYAQNLGTDNVCGANAGASTAAGRASSNEGYYTLSIEASSATGNAYTIVATPTGTQADDTDCNPMKITFSATNPGGLKTPADCW